ncbi:hypothetical protein BKN38_01890 [Helicobacter sp. CLO-3]|uniref:hypothetical protein n=1 Tax=unclassified Helicobacter TaxID=2593540 RepID=UPI0008052C6E|nr:MULTISPECIES: hypothetical protein [unclassified Helicobacter]OBV28971.1 hypothetical protein BA723_01200 [Helicobacter sp. CLO-3]OHU84816.1 hypothetical protein BKN38_01890 [Helicobacter sp. CLO-3]
MKCLSCARFCLGVLCERCLESIPFRLSMREVRGVRVYGFFAYDDVEFLLRTKYYAIGSRILARLARKAAHKCFGEVLAGVDLRGVCMVGIDDSARSFYSHTGVIMHEFAKASGLAPIYGELKAAHDISYAGKSLAYRQSHKRGLRYTHKERDLIIIDDIITTGTSFSEAIEVCQNAGAQVHLCLALCDARS